MCGRDGFRINTICCCVCVNRIGTNQTIGRQKFIPASLKAHQCALTGRLLRSLGRSLNRRAMCQAFRSPVLSHPQKAQYHSEIGHRPRCLRPIGGQGVARHQCVAAQAGLQGGLRALG